jgi:hypothetical protein
MSSELSRRRGFGEFIIVWIIEEEADVILNRIRNSIKIFHNANACINYIQNAKNENIFLVMSYLLIEEIIAQVHDLPQLNSIYIVDPTSSSTEVRYCKVKGIFSNISSLDEQLTESIRTAEENTIPISILSSNVTSINDLNTLDPSYMYSQLLKEILFELNYNEKEKKRFIEFCREQYDDNARELNIINEFEHDYRDHTPAWWYTRECFMYKMLNKALRTQNIDISWKIGFFIQDLHKQLEHLHSIQPNTSRILYRGQG